MKSLLGGEQVIGNLVWALFIVQSDSKLLLRLLDKARKRASNTRIARLGYIIIGY